MILPKFVLLAAIGLLSISASQCNKEVSKKTLRKIEFDHAMIDQKGLLNGSVMVDYEFCIPKNETNVAEVKGIEPDVNIPRLAKGRIGCSAEEYLCIVSTKGPEWRDRLYAIASLPYVKRIIQTDYE